MQAGKRKYIFGNIESPKKAGFSFSMELKSPKIIFGQKIYSLEYAMSNEDVTVV